MAYKEGNISDKTSSGIKSRIKFFDKEKNERPYLNELRRKIDEKMIAEKIESDLNLQINDKVSDKATIRKKHSYYIISCFDKVEDEDELKKLHEENMKSMIDNYIVENNTEDQKRDETIKQFCKELNEDFEDLLSKFKFDRNRSAFEHTKILEKVKNIYIREMDKHFLVPKFILVNHLQELHEKYKSLSHHKLREELLNRDIPKFNEQLNQSLEIIYDNFKRLNLSLVPQTSAIGIDLGTTYSCVGVMKEGKVHIIPNKDGLNTTPSYIAFTENGKTQNVGKSAKERAYINPANTIYDVKRMIGKKYNDISIQNDMKLWPFVMVNENDKLKVKLHNDEDTTLYPEEISAKILSELKSNAEDFLGFKVSNAVITVPAYFNDAQRQATKDAGFLAGLNVLQILNEPTAAAIAYSHQIKDDSRKNVLIYDLGGGTFDVAVVVIENGVIDVRAVGGDTHLGGVDFDQNVMNFLKFKTFEEEFSKSDEKYETNKAMARLRYQCERKKCELSEVSKVNITIDELLSGWDFRYTLERSKFEELCIDYLKKTISTVDQTLKSAYFQASDIDEVVLIGGSTRIPIIQTLLQQYFRDKPLNKDIKPDEAVAFGATIQAALLNGQTFIDSFKTLIHDVSPFSLGIELLDGTMSVFIPRNSRIPKFKSKTYVTSYDNQEAFSINIFEGEKTIAKENRLLGKFIIDGVLKKPAGEESIEVTMEINNEGILHVEAVSSTESADIRINDHRGRLSAEELQMLVNQSVGKMDVNEMAVDKVAVEEVVVEEVAFKEVAVDEVDVREVAVKEVAVEKVDVDKVAIEDMAVNEVDIREVTVKEVAAEEVAVNEMYIGGVVIEVAVGEADVDKVASDEVTVNGEAVDEVDVDKVAVSEIAFGEIPVDETSATR